MPARRFYPALLIHQQAPNITCVVEAVEFKGIDKTKDDALAKETSGIYNSANMDELIRNSHLAAKHMKVDLNVAERANSKRSASTEQLYSRKWACLTIALH